MTSSHLSRQVIFGEGQREERREGQRKVLFSAFGRFLAVTWAVPCGDLAVPCGALGGALAVPCGSFGRLTTKTASRSLSLPLQLLSVRSTHILSLKSVGPKGGPKGGDNYSANRPLIRLGL
ncbi:hypothetical protein O6H91_05G101100 [Diphasiastrum complanatum]|uniref:Uncharacterized protein n=1 Tax=Diphasiastrum complanatum TaxID=34168 RepID=A0ACC2DS87_DIPCM|nr:hypothetical protein O6H91_05G101100 [Diphasiastrum complanatum]